MTVKAQSVPVSQELSLKQFVIDALLYNSAISVLLVGGLAANAEMMVGDYPPDIQASWGPRSKKATCQALLLFIPFVVVGIGGLILSNKRMKKANGGRLSFAAAFTNAFGLIFSAWLFDLTILDWLLFVTITPSFVVLPGTEGLAGYSDYGFHLKAHMRALPLLVIPALVVAWLTASRPLGWASTRGRV